MTLIIILLVVLAIFGGGSFLSGIFGYLWPVLEIVIGIAVVIYIIIPVLKLIAGWLSKGK